MRRASRRWVLTRPDLPGPMRRRGPRPLALHLTIGARPDPANPAAAPIPDATLVAGIAAYRRHPYQRDLADPPVVWREGESRVLDYAAADAAGPVVLFVPSLVNRAYILDLAPGRSLLRFLAAAGVRAALLDWGWPSAAERRFGLDDYIAGRLARAVSDLAVDRPIVLVGYCMGGLLSLAAALRQPNQIGALGLLATPWDFHAADPDRAEHMVALVRRLEPLLAGGTLPVDAIQALFAMQDAAGVAAKYRAFASRDPASAAASMFVAMEDWLADGVPLAAPVARECLGGWYGDNSTARGVWQVAGMAVDPAALRIPTFVAVPGHDRIVPPESARPLARLIAGSTLVEPPTGHVAMVAGRRADMHLWNVLLGWLRAL